MKKIIVVVAAATLLAGGAYYVMSSKHSMAQNGMMGGEMPPAPVKTQTIASETITLYETLPGRTAAHRVAQIRPQVSGIITERKFEEGSLVEEGQQLYQIDPAPYRAAYNRALADLQKARANAKAIEAKAARFEELVKINAVSLQEYDDVKAAQDQAKADIAVANAMVATAKVDLDYTKVYAPISGRIGKSSVTEGALVTAGQSAPLTVITQLDPIYVDMSQSTADLMRLRGANDLTDQSPVEITLTDSNKLYDQQGTLQFSDVSVDETTSSVQLRALFPNPEEDLLPGLFVRARIHLGTKKAILVPQRATVRNPDGNLIVWTVTADNTAQPRPIEIEREYNDQWIVSAGLQPGDVIIVEGYQKVGPGAPVMPEGEQPQGLIPAAPAQEEMPDTADMFPEDAPLEEQPPQESDSLSSSPPPEQDAVSAEDVQAETVEDMSLDTTQEEPNMSAQDLLNLPVQDDMTQ